MQKYKIIFIGDSIDVGGAGKMIKFVANAMTDCDYKVYLLSLCQFERPTDLKDDVEYIPGEKDASFSLRGRLRMLKIIRRCVKGIKPTIICSFTSEVAFMSRIATIGLSTLFASAERGDPYSLPFFWKILVKWAYNKSDACFFQLEKAKQFFNQSIQGKSFIIPNPFILSTPVQPYDGKRNKTIVSAGRFVSEKGFDVLIDAFSLVVKRRPEYNLIIWGEGPLLQDYKRKIKTLGIEEKVFFPGYSNNVANCVRKEGIFVLSSRYEGIPNVLIEALSVGIPVVATNCSPGGPEFLTGNGERGIIVPMDNSEAMAGAIINLIEDDVLYHLFEVKGPEIRALLDKNLITTMWNSAFGEIIEKNNNNFMLNTYANTSAN